MKYSLLMLLIITLLAGCSGGLFATKDRDARNSFVERPLVIPANIDTAIFAKAPTISQDDYMDAMVFQLIFNEDLNKYKQETDKLALTMNDIEFLRKANASKSYPNIRNEINQESLSITSKNNRFLNKLLHWQVNESIKNPSKEYKEIK